MPTTQQIDSFRKKAKAKGFSAIQIEQSIAKRIQTEAKTSGLPQQGPQRSQINPVAPVSPNTPEPITSTTPTQPNYSWGGLLKNAGQDIADFAVNQPMQTFNNLKTMGKEIGRTAILKGATSGTNSVIDQQLAVIKKLKSEKDPVKKQELLAKSRQLSDQMERGNKILDKATTVSPEEQQNLESIPKSPAELGKGMLKNIGRTFGLKQGADGSIVFDPMEAVQSAYEKPVSTALLLKDGAGALRNITKTKPISVVDDIAGKTGKTSSLENMGNKLRKEVLNPQADASPFYADDIAGLQKAQEKIGLSGSAEHQLSQLPEAFKKSQKEIKTLLNKAKPPEKGILTGEFTKQVDNANYNLSDPQFAKAVELEAKILKSLEGKSATAQYEQLSKYRDLLKSTRKKVDAGTTLLPKEEARLSAFNALKETIDTVSPEVKAINTLQNQMYNISEGLVKKSKEAGKPIQVLGTNVPVPGQTIQGIQDLTGRTIERTGQIGGGIVSTAKDTVNKVAPGTGVAMEATSALNLENPSYESDQQNDPIEDNSQGDGKQDDNQENFQQEDLQSVDSISQSHPIFGDTTRQEVLLQAFKSGLNQKQIAEIETLYDKFAPPEQDQTQLSDQFLETGKPLTRADKVWALEHPDKIPGKSTGASGGGTEKERMFLNAGKAGQKALDLLDTGNIATGIGEGIKGKIGEKTGANSQEQQRYRSTVAIARTAAKNALLGANMSGAEMESIEAFIPEYNDAPEIAKEKLATFIELMNEFAGVVTTDTTETKAENTKKKTVETPEASPAQKPSSENLKSKADATTNALYGAGPQLLNEGAKKLSESKNPFLSKVGKVAKVATSFIAPSDEQVALIMKGYKTPEALTDKERQELSDSALISTTGTIKPLSSQKVGKILPRVDEEDLKGMVKLLDFVRTRKIGGNRVDKDVALEIEKNARYIVEGMGLNPDQKNTKLADIFEQILDGFRKKVKTGAMRPTLALE